MEVWRDIPGWQGMYAASSEGRIKTLSRVKTGRAKSSYVTKERIRRQSVNRFGYKTIILIDGKRRKSYKVHQLVAMAFLNHLPCGHKKVVDHIDGNKLNNTLRNLQVISNRENCIKDKKQGSSKYVGVCWDRENHKWIAQIHYNGKTKKIGRFRYEQVAAKAYQSELKKVLNGTNTKPKLHVPSRAGAQTAMDLFAGRNP